MHDILPEGEDLRRAIRFVSACLQEGTEKTIHQLVHDATFKFDLSPKDADFLMDFFRRRKDEG